MRKPRIRNARLVAAIASHGFTNRSLAAATGLCEATLSKIINYRVEPAPETRRRIASALASSQHNLFAAEGK